MCLTYAVAVNDPMGDPLGWKLKTVINKLWGNQKEVNVMSIPKEFGLRGVVDTFSGKNLYCSSPSSTPPSSLQCRPYPFGLEKNGIRVLLYRECDRRGRKLLYDSQTVLRSPLPESPTHVQCSSRFFRSPLSARLGPTTSSSSQILLSGSSPSKGTTEGRCLNEPGVSKLVKQRSSNGETYVEVRNGFGYQYLKESGDTKQIGELVFGSVALAFKGSSSKLHMMKEPSRILMSRTFRAPRSYRSTYASCDTGIEDSFSSLSNSFSEFHLTKLDASRESSFTKSYCRASLPQDTGGKETSGCLKASQSEDDSGFSGPPSPFSSVCGSYLNPGSLPCTPMGTPSSRNGSGSSLNKSSGSVSSLQRRFLRNVATSLESFGFASMDDEHKDENRSSYCSAYQTKLGLAVVIETKQESSDTEKQAEEWWFNQQEVLESLINKLQMSLEDAYLHRAKFVSLSFQAIAQLQQELDDLISAPRLVDPLWLSLFSVDCDKTRERLHSKLIHSLAFLLTSYDTKQTNFFISKLLTGVLSHHLGWVSTVGPQISLYSHKERQTGCISDILANYLTKALPYNALWGQLCELTGSIGYPSKVTRTVVVGTDKEVLDHILVVLSYFVRCSQVVQNHYDDNDCFGDSPCSLKSTDSSRSSLTSVMTLVESNLATTENSGRNNNSSKSSHNCKSLRKKSNVNDLPRNSLSCTSEVEEAEEVHTCKSDARTCISDVQMRTCVTGMEEFGSHKDNSGFSDQQKLHSVELDVCPGSSSSASTGLTTSKTMGNLCMLSDSPSDSSSVDSSHRSTSPGRTPPRESSTATSLRDTPYRETSLRMDPSMEASSIIGTSRVTPTKEVPLRGFSSRVTPPRYPDLRVMDDHKETFGPADIQPEVIAEKVKKLCRVPDDQETTRSTHKSEIKVSGEKFDLEIEKGGKVLFTLGEDEKLEGLKPKIFGNSSLVEEEKSKSNVNTQRTKDERVISRRRRTSDPEVLQGISALPRPVSIGKTVDSRRQGSAASESKVSIPDIRAPGCSEQSSIDTGNKIVGSKISRTLLPYQRRHMSDPIGLSSECVPRMPQYKKALEAVDERLEASNTVPSLTYGNKDDSRNKISTQDATNESVEEWDTIDRHSKIVDNISLNLRTEKQSGLNIAESLLGGILGHYSSIFVVHATTRADHLEEQIRADLVSAVQHPVLNAQTCEAVAIVAEIGKWEIEVVSSHSFSIERKSCGSSSSSLNYGGVPVMISPLVSQISDCLLNLIRIEAPASFVVQCLEHHLRGVYLKSQLLSEYLIEGAQASLSKTEANSYMGGKSLYNLTELTHTLGIDVNDLPLLLSVASTHTPALTQMFGLTVK